MRTVAVANREGRDGMDKSGDIVGTKVPLFPAIEESLGLKITAGWEDHRKRLKHRSLRGLAGSASVETLGYSRAFLLLGGLTPVSGREEHGSERRIRHR